MSSTNLIDNVTARHLRRMAGEDSERLASIDSTIAEISDRMAAAIKARKLELKLWESVYKGLTKLQMMPADRRAAERDRLRLLMTEAQKAQSAADRLLHPDNILRRVYNPLGMII